MIACTPVIKTWILFLWLWGENYNGLAYCEDGAVEAAWAKNSLMRAFFSADRSHTSTCTTLHVYSLVFMLAFLFTNMSFLTMRTYRLCIVFNSRKKTKTSAKPVKYVLHAVLHWVTQTFWFWSLQDFDGIVNLSVQAYTTPMHSMHLHCSNLW